MVSINLNFSNKAVYLFVGIFLVILVMGIAYAVGTGTIPNPGHAIEELEECADGETLVMVGGDWTCGASAGGSSFQTVWTGSIDGSQLETWKCIQPPFDLCEGKGCSLKMKISRASDNYLWTYEGTVDNNGVYVSFNAGGTPRVWKITDNLYGGSWTYEALVWLGDCSLASAGSCAAPNDIMNLCVYKGYKLESILIKY